MANSPTLIVDVGVGAQAPDFTLSDQDGNPVHHLVALRGKTVVLYFYPKADGSG